MNAAPAKSPRAAARSKSARAAAASSSSASSGDISSVAPEDGLPGAEDIEAARVPVRDVMQSPAHARVRGFLDRLSSRPPQVLLLEGGNADSRLAAAHYWMLLLNCDGPGRAPKQTDAPRVLPGLPASPGPGLPGLPVPAAPAAERGGPDKVRPCLDCPTCIRLLTHLHRDCFFLDGAAGSIKIDEVRAVRSVLGEPPREAAFRVVIFREAQSLVEAAANALLKSFEEPRPATSFLLLAPQRERLLPTLVSRSMVLTLPWPDAGEGEESLAAWEAALCAFLASGRDFLEKSGAKGTVDAALAHALTNLCRRALVGCIKTRQSGAPAAEGLESLFLRMPEARLRMLDEALAECQDSLVYGVNPTLVLEWLATRLFFLVPRGAKP